MVKEEGREEEMEGVGRRKRLTARAERNPANTPKREVEATVRKGK